ncbi:MAG: RNA polymerase sigma factor [bacterium]
MKMVKNTEEAKDLAGETFIRVFNQIEKFRLDAPFSPWLKRIATNLCIDHLRKRSRFRHQVIEEHQGATHPDMNGELVNQNNLRKKILHVLKGLKPAQRRCFCLFYLHDLSYREITKLTGYSFDQVRSHIQNGRRKFKILMEKA